MYSMVLMAAMLPSGDTASFGKHKGGCDGGCSGAVASSGCHGSRSGGFLGHKDKGGCNGRSGGCNGRSGGCNGGGGFLGLHKSKGSCHGTPAPACDHCAPVGCIGSGAASVPPPPVVMPKPEVKPDPKPKPKTGD